VLWCIAPATKQQHKAVDRPRRRRTIFLLLLILLLLLNTCPSTTTAEEEDEEEEEEGRRRRRRRRRPSSRSVYAAIQGSVHAPIILSFGWLWRLCSVCVCRSEVSKWVVSDKRHARMRQRQ